MKVSEYTEPGFLKRYKEKSKAHWYNLYPGFLRVLGKIKGKKILDIGCGSGEFTKKLADMGANVTGIDISKKWIEFCNRTHKSKNLKFFHSDGADLKLFGVNTFDIVTINMVLLNVPTLSKVRKIFNESSRVLKKEGILVFSDLHPICIMSDNLPNRKQFYSKNFSYFKDGSQFIAQVSLSRKSKIKFQDVHWTLETYSKLINESGMKINRIIEPQYIKNSPKIFKKYKIPEYIIIECQKLS